MIDFRHSMFVNFLVWTLMPTLAGAAGTYYTGTSYQPAQYRYGQSASYGTSNYSRTGTVSANPNARYNTNYQATSQTQNETQTTTRSSSQKKSQSGKSGFYAHAGITHEEAMWKFDMNEAKSVLRYNDVAWNVLDLNGGYVFDLGKTKMQVDAGFKYGMQWDSATMMDDDVTNGGYDVTVWKVGDTIIGKQIGRTLSIGTSKSGNMFGFNIGAGLTDFMKIGDFKVTPSIGYRYFKYKLETKNNHVLTVDTSTIAGGCVVDSFGETVCDPVYIFYNSDGEKVVVTRDHINGNPVTGTGEDAPVPSGYSYVYAGGTSYYEQPGVSHSYEVEWSGPYIAMDMDYEINQNNSINGRLEFGFPGYKATGDQPYRWDWAHPKSVQDSAGMFSAFHLGATTNWVKAISNSMSLSIGVTYDYYSVSGAKAETYLNQPLYNQLANKTDRTEIEEVQMMNLERASQECGGWVCKADKEIDSIYKSLGIRVGIDARF